MLSNAISRYRDAYSLYHLLVRRFVVNMSVVTRYMNSAHYARKYRVAYSPYEQLIAAKHPDLAPHTEVEIVNCLIHASILLDRLAALLIGFLPADSRRTLMSFSDHKKFFKN